jgi:hypothetical protein
MKIILPVLLLCGIGLSGCGDDICSNPLALEGDAALSQFNSNAPLSTGCDPLFSNGDADYIVDQLPNGFNPDQELIDNFAN